MLHAKKQRGETLTPFGHLPITCCQLETSASLLHGVISQDCVSTNISLYGLWTKKIFVIFLCIFVFNISVSEWGQRQTSIKYIFLL